MAPLTFTDTHDMVAFLSKSDASEGFDQIVDFLNAHTIKYALVVNPTIYVSCIKQFWATAIVKKVNNVVQLRALIDGKKVVVSEAIIIIDLHLDDADGVEYLSNEEIFMELARIGAKRTACNEFSFSMASAVICLATGTPTTTSESSMPLLTTLMETCATLSQKVTKLEQDKHSQALEILQLNKRVKKLEKKKKSKSSGFKRLRRIETAKEVVAMDAESQGKIYQEEVNAASKGVSGVEPTVFDDEDVTMTMA
uniref:Xylulose kinase-1 n=1 Tax=Tanacetum cinerariifolium TaxID=118510 RepID=A0A6L2KVZ6_TANCI|nr:hypothetical protein [Tanacetum cinerariifolium]